MLALFMICLLHSVPSRAQFLRLEIVIEDDISIVDARTLQTDIIPANFGWFHIQPNDELAGRLTISTAENINLYVSIQAPNELVMDQDNKLPFVLEAAYLNTGNMNVRNAIPFDGQNTYFPMNNSGLLADNMPASSIPLRSTIFFYGSIYVGMVDPGVYSGVVNVTIEF